MKKNLYTCITDKIILFAGFSVLVFWSVLLKVSIYFPAHCVSASVVKITTSSVALVVLYISEKDLSEARLALHRNITLKDHHKWPERLWCVQICCFDMLLTLNCGNGKDVTVK